MLILRMLLLSQALCHRVYGAESHTFTMVQRAYFSNGTSVEIVGHTTLDGRRTHSLESGNGYFNVSQLLPLESSDLWELRKNRLQKYLSEFKDLVSLLVTERNVPYPLEVNCMAACQLSENGTNGFYEVLLNKVEFLRFHTVKNQWERLQETPAAEFASTNLNKYNETSTDLQFFLQETCISFIRQQTDVKGALSGKREGRSHAPLVLGISIGSLAVMGLAVCIFLCTGGKR